MPAAERFLIKRNKFWMNSAGQAPWSSAGRVDRPTAVASHQRRSIRGRTPTVQSDRHLALRRLRRHARRLSRRLVARRPAPDRAVLPQQQNGSHLVRVRRAPLLRFRSPTFLCRRKRRGGDSTGTADDGRDGKVVPEHGRRSAGDRARLWRKPVSGTEVESGESPRSVGPPASKYDVPVNFVVVGMRSNESKICQFIISLSYSRSQCSFSVQYDVPVTCFADWKSMSGPEVEPGAGRGGFWVRAVA